MGIKVKLLLHKEFEVEIGKDVDTDGVVERLKENGVESGTSAGPRDIQDAIESMLADDIDYVVNLDLDETNFSIEVPANAILEVPEDEEDSA